MRLLALNNKNMKLMFNASKVGTIGILVSLKNTNSILQYDLQGCVIFIGIFQCFSSISFKAANPSLIQSLI